MEPYPFHYSRGLKSDESVNPNFRVMLDELQRMEARLMDMIERQCGSLDCHVLDVQKKTEERLISLKTLRLRWDVQTSRNNLMVFSWWWVTSIASWSMRLGNPQVKQGIFTNPSLGATAGGSNNCRVDRISPTIAFRALVCLNSGFCIATLSTPMNRVILVRTIPMLSPSVQLRASYLKSIFRCSMLKTSSCGNLIVKVTLKCMVLSPLFG
jgi:hypothetical protein